MSNKATIVDEQIQILKGGLIIKNKGFLFSGRHSL